MDFTRAQQADLDFLYQLRNEAASVAYSKRGALSRQAIADDYLHNAQKQVFVVWHASTRGATAGAASDTEPVEQTRIAYIIYEQQPTDATCFEISIALVPASRGQGLAQRIVHAAAAYAVEHVSATLLIAAIYPSNSASVRLFQACGYVPSESNDSIETDNKPNGGRSLQFWEYPLVSGRNP